MALAPVGSFPSLSIAPLRYSHLDQDQGNENFLLTGFLLPAAW
jgi:hypothetical protein